MEARIYAKKGTKEKIVVRHWHADTAKVQSSLNEQLGGSWIYVDRMKEFEAIRFTDGMEYHGYGPDIERYSDKIINVNKSLRPS